MPIDLFGFSIGRKGREDPKPISSSSEGDIGNVSFVAPDAFDGTVDVEAGGIFGHYIDFHEKVKNENEKLNLHFYSISILYIGVC